MTIVNAYGFSLDLESGRVYLTEGKVATFRQELPIGSDEITRGADHGDIINSTPKVILNADANLIYVDLAGKPYAGTVKTYSNLPHDELGRLLVDSVGKIVSHYKGLGFTEFGGVAMLATDVPNAPKLNNAYAEKNSVVLDFDYDISANDKLEPKYYTGYAVGGGKTFKAEVYDPDEDMLIDGLTEGTAYDCYVTATSATGKEGAKSNVIQTTCKSVIPAPVFTSCVSGDGFASVTYKDITPPEPWVVTHYAYSAINLNDKTQPAMEGHIIDGKIALTNDITWYVRICAVCNPGRVPGDFSDALTVTPEKKVAPFRPTVTQAFAQPAGQVFVEWVKGTTSNGSRQSGMTVDQWKIAFHSIDSRGVDFEQTVAGDVTSLTSQKVSIGVWEITVTGHNDQGWGTASKPVAVEYKPASQDPLLGGIRYYNDKFNFAVFYGEETTGYQAVRTEYGKNLSFDVLMIGAGGSGKGQTVTLGKGGDGGGGQMVLGTLPPTMNTSTITITVPAGGTRSGDSPGNVTVVETTTTLTAISGKSATDKNNAEGFPKTKAPDGWNDIMPFTWLLPGSQYVGGVAEPGEQNFPNATFSGQGGAGTKDSNPGKGGHSVVIIRWTK